MTEQDVNITDQQSQVDVSVTDTLAVEAVNITDEMASVAVIIGTAPPIPVVFSAVIDDDAKSDLVIAFDIALDETSIPATTAFTIPGKTISNVAISGINVTLTVTVAFIGSDSVTVDYTQPASNSLKGTAGGIVESFSNQAVTNNIIPDLLTAVIENAAPADVVLTFDASLDEGSVPATSAFDVSDRTVSAIDVSGPVVTVTVTVDFEFEQVVTIDYTKPGSNPLKSTEGGEVDTFAGQAVTNNVESSFSEEYLAVYDEFTSKPSESDKDAQNTFVQTMLDGGVWAKRDRIFFLASHAGGADSLIDWEHPTGTGATMVGSLAWTQYQGWLGKNFSYINPNYKPKTQGVTFLKDSASISWYLRVNTATSGDNDFGCSDNASNDIVSSTRNTATIRGQMNDNDSDPLSIVKAEFIGQLSIDRSASNVIKGYHEGIEQLTRTDASTDIPDQDLSVLALKNKFGIITGYAVDRQMAYFSAGGSLTPAENLIEAQAVQALMTHYGTAV